MVGKIICWVISLGCAILFYSIGAYAEKQEKPMWFWSGTKVDPSQIADVKQYNKENGVMWKRYALWYVAAAIAEIWSELAFGAILVLSCTVGLAMLVRSYTRIFNKYRVK